MRLVALLVLTLGSLSVGCAIEAGDPSTTDEPQHHDEIVAVSGSGRPITPKPGPTPTSATGTSPEPQVGGGSTTLPANAPPGGGGTTLQADNPNPSPWDPHAGQ